MKRLADLPTVHQGLGIGDRCWSDHGSRIYQHYPNADNQSELSDVDYLDSFSTLLAVNGPRDPPGYDRRVGLRRRAVMTCLRWSSRRFWSPAILQSESRRPDRPILSGSDLATGQAGSSSGVAHAPAPRGDGRPSGNRATSGMPSLPPRLPQSATAAPRPAGILTGIGQRAS